MVGGHRTQAPCYRQCQNLEGCQVSGLVVCLGIGGMGGHIGVNRSSSVAEEGLMNLGNFFVGFSISRYTQGRNKERLEGVCLLYEDVGCGGCTCV